MLFLFYFFLNVKAWNPWTTMYQRNETSIPIQSDLFAFYANTELDGPLIDPTLQIYYRGFFPYVSYMSLSTYNDINGLIASQQKGSHLLPTTKGNNPFQPGANVTSSLNERIFELVILDKGSKPIDPNPIFLTNQLYWPHSPINGRITATSITYRAYNAFVAFPTGLTTPFPFPTISKIIVQGKIVLNPEIYFKSLVTNIFHAFFSPVLVTSLIFSGILIRSNAAPYSNPWESPDAQEYPPNVPPSQILWYRWPSRAIPLSDQTPGQPCSGYLIAAVPRTYTDQESVAIIRMKLPSSFNFQKTPDTYPSNLDTAYVSISIYGYEQFYDYTVNGNELEAIKDKYGYIIIFLLPKRFRDQIPGYQQNEGAPVFNWGLYQGLVLPYPRYAPSFLEAYPSFPEFVPPPILVLREKDQSDTFKVNGGIDGFSCPPSNISLGIATGPLHYNEWQASKPNSSLKDYAPVSYGDTFVHFLQGSIGIVKSNQTWPSTN